MPHEEISYPYGKMPDYPHMGPADEAIWNRFIENNPDRFVRVFYDFLVGNPAEALPDMPHNLTLGWYDLTRWRCDVVADDGKAIYIIEVKPSANANAIGKAISYRVLFVQQERPDKKVIPVILTDAIFETTKQVADLLGVRLWTPEKQNAN